MLFPLGSACKVRESIQRYLDVKSIETNLFDWMITNFDTILYFIENINTPIKPEDIFDTNNTCIDKRIILHKNARFESYHDFEASVSYEEQLQTVLNKYNRRLKRLKNIILSNEKIDFIHLFDMIDNYKLPDTSVYVPSIQEINRFFEAIKKINPYCNFNLHLLVPPNNCRHYNKHFHIDTDEVNKLKINNVFLHYLTQDYNVETMREKCNHWSWFDVYNKINLNY